MLDIIIPVYNDIKSLAVTLSSLNYLPQRNIFVTIVDDGADNDYSSILKIYSKMVPIKVIKMPEHKGPGCARQYGIEKTQEEYFTFIDCGDIVTSPNAIPQIIKIIQDNPTKVLFCFPHLSENKIGELELIPETHNRIHGKFYKRSFIQSHKITFCEESSSCNEDIGFNMACKLIASQDEIYYNPDIDFITWKYNNNSLTRNNDHAFFYKEQNIGLAKNMEHAINIARQNNANEQYIIKEIYSSMIEMYFSYISTANRRPEFKEESFNGCVYFYKNFFKAVGDKNIELFKYIFYENLVSICSERDNPVRDKFLTLNIIDFLNMLEDACCENKTNTTLTESSPQIDENLEKSLEEKVLLGDFFFEN